MSKKFTQKQLEAVIDFLQKGTKTLMTTDYTLCRLNINEKLAICIGWTDGYDEVPQDGELYKKGSPTWRINVSVKIRNDYEWDYDYLAFPWDKNSGDCWDTSITINKDEDYKQDAEWLLEEAMNIIEAHKRGTVVYDYKEIED